jgi:hypothetical protein
LRHQEVLLEGGKGVEIVLERDERDERGERAATAS